MPQYKMWLLDGRGSAEKEKVVLLQKSLFKDLVLVRTLWRLSDDVHEVLGRILVDGGENVVELGRVAGDSMKCELYFRLSKPESGLMCPESR